MSNATQTDADAAVAFLREFHGEDPWVLTAIDPRGGGIVTQTFGCETFIAAQKFIERWSNRRNVYFTPAVPAAKLVAKKPTKEDIAHTNYLWIDLDPRAGEDLVDERARILSLLTDRLPAQIPGPPTFIVDSGRGYWGFWRLNEPAGREAEDYMRGLQRIFGSDFADSCHDICRIARLPGTTNLKTGAAACTV